MVYDMTKLPMRGVSDNTYDGVYSEHFIEHLTKKEFKKNLNKKFGILPKSIPLTEQKVISDEIDEQESSEIINNSKKIASRIINGLSYKDD